MTRHRRGALYAFLSGIAVLGAARAAVAQPIGRDGIGDRPQTDVRLRRESDPRE